MKKGLTELVFIIDKSGSMHNMIGDTVGGFNSMIERQRRVDGDVYVTTILFNHRSEMVHDRVSISEIGAMTEDDYCPGGSTALLDAVGGAIRHISDIHKYVRDEDVPEHTVFVITTDGMENASSYYSLAQVKDMIRRQSEENGWEFLFVAANIDAAQTADEIGIKPGCSAEYRSDTDGMSDMYEAFDIAVTRIRSGHPVGIAWKSKLEQQSGDRSRSSRTVKLMQNVKMCSSSPPYSNKKYI